MAGLATLVTDFSSRVEGATVRRGAVPGNMAQLPACVALHGLRLAVTCIVIWPTALVACCSPVVADHSSSEAATISTTRSTSTTNIGLGIRVWAIASQVTNLATSIAATAGSTTVEAKSRAICLDVT